MNATSSVDSSMEEKVPSLTCEICIEPMTESNNYFNNKNRCAHPFCSDCIFKCIEAKLMEENTAEVSCPASNYDEFLDPLTCRSILPARLFERRCHLLCKSAVLRCDDQIQSSVYCPFTDCSALVLNECWGNNITRSECPNCKKLFCFHCKIPWLVGLRCNETDEQQLRDENDILFGKLVGRNKWIRRPSCNFYVMKIDDCVNITCRCGVFFCYVCGKIKNACDCNRGNMPLRRPVPLGEPIPMTAKTYVGDCMIEWICGIFISVIICFVFGAIVYDFYLPFHPYKQYLFLTIIHNTFYNKNRFVNAHFCHNAFCFHVHPLE